MPIAIAVKSPIVSDRRAPSGLIELRFEFEKTGTLKGIGRLYFGEECVAKENLDRILLRTSLAPMSIGKAALPPLSPMLQGEAAFDGKVERIAFDLGDDRELVPETLDVD